MSLWHADGVAGCFSVSEVDVANEDLLLVLRSLVNLRTPRVPL